MIWGDALVTLQSGEQTLILNTRWPQRALFRLKAAGSDQAYVWDDCYSDAIESYTEWFGCESDEDATVHGDEIKRGSHVWVEIQRLTDAVEAE